MKKPRRYHPSQAFPPYRFLPGVHKHPNGAGGYRENLPDPVADKISDLNPKENETLCYALDLFNHEYYWESHIYLEALWNSHERVGVTAEFLKGFIKLAAAGVKFKNHEILAGRTHLQNAREHFLSVQAEVQSTFLGFPVHEMIESVNLAIPGEGTLFQVHPEWELDFEE